ncbi:KAP family P-loop NTPase fold protein [Hallerella porci]|uniref:KAP-like P-loop domain-containing protein n=1 Tax=Hallerella porci TaxID=1945871 RepID=A0ABX5LKZ1_9BACT|nr:P-loop NTPase fold protein [Hallerella porci]PWK92254.1 KAP-like P-loop domain-containing protein [Hallerella porci]
MPSTTDLLSRDQFVSIVSNIVDSKIKQKEGYSFAIDGEWGCGKTTVLDILEERLKSRCLVVRYNCWKYDFYEEPLIALLSEFAKAINSEQSFDYEEQEKKAWKIAGKICSDVTSKLIQVGTGLDIKAAVEYVNSLRTIAEEERIQIENVNDKLPIEFLIEQIQNDLGTLSSFENRGIVLMVDELDRCLPDYAIKVLERLHHFCGNTRIIQILAINKKEISGSIAKAFGYPNAEPEKVEHFASHYMQKFIDMTLLLDNGTINDPQTLLFSSLENLFTEYDNLDKTFVADFIRNVLKDIPMRNLKQVVKAVSSMHSLCLCEYPEKERKFSYALMCAEILECVQGYYFNGAHDIDVDFSKSNSIRIALKVPSLSIERNNVLNHRAFRNRAEEMFSCRTKLVDPFYTSYSGDVYEFYIETPVQKVLRLFAPDQSKNIGYKTIPPEYLMKDIEFFKIFKKNLDVLRIQ